MNKLGEPNQAMENTVIYLPRLKEQAVGWFGELWHCNTVSNPGSNILNLLGDDPFTEEFVEVFPLQDAKFHLRHIRDAHDRVNSLEASAYLSMELMGTIKVAGSASFESSNETGYQEEELFVQMAVNTCVARLRPSVVRILNPVVVDRVKNEGIATHYVKEIRFGGNALGSLRLSENKNARTLHLGGSFEGKFPVGPIVLGIKASLEFTDSESASNYSTTVKLDSTPYLGNPISVKEMFECLDTMDANLNKKYNPKFFKTQTVTGESILFKLAPLTDLFDTGRPPSYLILEEETTAAYTEMLFHLHDFGQKTHIKRLVRAEDSRMSILFGSGAKDDPRTENPLTIEVTEFENTIRDLAIQLKTESFDCFSQYKIGKTTLSDLEDILDNYRTIFKLPDILAKVTAFTTQGRLLLAAVHSADAFLAEKTDLFLSSPRELSEWLNTITTNIRILFRTDFNTENGTQEASGFLKLYSMIPALESTERIEVKVAYPNVASGFGLDIKILAEISTYGAKEMDFTMDFLNVFLPMGAMSNARLFYTLLGQTAGYKMDFEGISEFPTTLNALKAEARDVKICETFPGFLEAILTSQTEWVFVLPIQGLDSATEMVRGYRDFRHQLACSNISHQWVVGQLNISNVHTEAPVLLVFRNGILVATCLDYLDVHILLQNLLTPAPSIDISVLEPFRLKTMHHRRANFSTEIFNNLGIDHHIFTPVNPLPSFDSPQPAYLDATIQVARVTCGNDVRKMTALIANFALALPDWKDKLEPLLKRHGWLVEESKFEEEVEPETWKKLSENLLLLLEEFSEISETFHITVLKDLTADLGNEVEIRLDNICSKYLQQCQLEENGYLGQDKAIKDALRDGQYYEALCGLAQCQCDHRLFKLQKDLRSTLSHLRGIDLRRQTINAMKSTYEFTDRNAEDIWSNPKFEYWMLEGVENDGLIGATETVFSKGGTIPQFIPIPIASKIKLAVTPVDEEFDWPINWDNASCAVQAFQLILTRRVIPRNFDEVLLKNIEGNSDLKFQFQEAGVLFYWLEEEARFEEPWGVDTIGNALEGFMRMRGIVTSVKNHTTQKIAYVIKKGTFFKARNVQPIDVNMAWIPFTGGRLHPLTPFKFGVPQQLPMINISILPTLLEETIPYLMEQIRNGNAGKALHPNQVIKYVDYTYGRHGIQAPGQLPLEGVDIEKPLKFLVSRSDFLIALLTAASFDPVATLAVLREMDRVPMAIPVIIPDISLEPSKDGVPVRTFLPALELLVPSDLKAHVYSKQTKVITVLRVGATPIGKSTVLNQTIMADVNTFSCRIEPGAEYGRPVSRDGLVEAIWLSERTCSESFWRNVAQNFQETILLLNVHGDALGLPNVLQILSKLTSSFVVFWAPSTWNELKNKRNKLTRLLPSNLKALHVVIDPSTELEIKIGSQNAIRTENLIDGNLKLEKVFYEAINYTRVKSADESSKLPLLSAMPKSTQDILIPSITTPESIAFLSFIENNGVRQVRAMLDDSSPGHDEAIRLFTDVLNLALRERNMALTHIRLELEHMTEITSEYELRKVAALNQLLKEGVVDLEVEIKSALSKLDKSRLYLNHFFHTLNSQNQTEEYYDKLFELMNSGMPLEVFNETHGDVLNSAGIEFCFQKFKDQRTFVLSITGLAGSRKSTILNSLFGNGFRVGPGGCTKGIVMRLLPLDQELSEELQIDSILVLDSEGIRVPHNREDLDASSREVKLLTLLLGLSHLTLVNIGEKEDILPLEAAIQMSLLELWPQPKLKYVPDLLFLHNSEDGNNANLETLVHDIRLFAKKYAFGIAGMNQDRFCLEKILHRTPLPSISLDDLHKELIESMRLCDQISLLGDWYNYARSLCSQLPTMNQIPKLPAKHQHLEQLDQILTTEESLAEARLLMVTALQKHGDIIQEEYLLAARSGEAEDVCEHILKKLNRYPYMCSDEDGSLCPECKAVVTKVELMAKEHVVAFRMYAKESRATILDKIRQMGTAEELRTGRQGGKLELTLTAILEEYNTKEEQWRKYQQYISTLCKVVRGGRLLESELKSVYGHMPHLVARLPLDSTMDRCWLSSNDRAFESEKPWFLCPTNEQAEPTMLDWEQVYWLQMDLEDIVSVLLLDLDGDTHSTYKAGMVQRHCLKVTEFLEKMEIKWGQKLLSEVKWDVHFYALSVLLREIQQVEMGWNDLNNPSIQLEAKKEVFPELFETGYQKLIQ